MSLTEVERTRSQEWVDTSLDMRTCQNACFALRGLSHDLKVWGLLGHGDLGQEVQSDWQTACQEHQARAMVSLDKTSLNNTASASDLKDFMLAYKAKSRPQSNRHTLHCTTLSGTAVLIPSSLRVREKPAVKLSRANFL